MDIPLRRLTSLNSVRVLNAGLRIIMLQIWVIWPVMPMNDIFPLNVSILLIVMYFLIILTSKILSSNYLAVHILFESVILISVLIDEFGQQNLWSWKSFFCYHFLKIWELLLGYLQLCYNLKIHCLVIWMYLKAYSILTSTKYYF